MHQALAEEDDWAVVKLNCGGAEADLLRCASPVDFQNVRILTGEIHFRAANVDDRWILRQLDMLGFPKHGLRVDRRDPTSRAVFWGRKS